MHRNDERVEARDVLDDADYREHPPARWTRRSHTFGISGGLRVDEHGYDADGNYYAEYDGWDGTR